MTAKKDLKKSKSKKKVKKYNQPNYRKKEQTAVEAPKRKGIFGNASKKQINDRNIAILSLIESIILLVLIVLLIFVKPGNDFGNMVLSHNKILADLVFTNVVKYSMVSTIVACFIIYALGYKKNREYKSFYTSGMTFLGVEILFILTQTNKSFELYGYGMLIVIAMTIIEMLKYSFMVNYLKKNKETI